MNACRNLGPALAAGTLAALLLVSPLLRPQALPLPDDEYHFRASAYRPEATLVANASLVQVEAVVRNQGRASVDGLAAANFQIRADGIPQRIAGFEVERAAPAPAAGAGNAPAVPAAPAATPLSVAFFVDDFNTDLAGLDRAGQGIRRYVGALPPAAAAAIATPSGIGSQDFTRDRALLDAALAALAPRARGCGADATYADSDFATPHSQFHFHGKGISGPDAVAAGPCSGGQSVDLASGEEMAQATLDALLAQVQRLGQQPGDRVLLLASDGVFSALNGHEVGQIADAALRDRVTINALDTHGSQEELTARRLDLLADLSHATGGTFLYGDNDLGADVAKLAAKPAIAYLLAFAPSPAPRDGALHPIAVSLVGVPGMAVAARAGYYAPAPEPPGWAALREKVRLAALAQDAPRALPAQMRFAGGEVQLTLDAAALPLPRLGDRRANTVMAVAVLFDGSGKFVAGAQGRLDLGLRDATWQTLAAAPAGIPFSLRLAAPAGSYRLRAVIAEAHSGLLSAFSEPITLP